MPSFDGAVLPGRRVLISGGTGFLGRSLLDHLLTPDRNAQADGISEVCVMSRDPAAFLAHAPRYRDRPGLSFTACSLVGDAWRVTLDGPFTDVIHAATTPHIVGAGSAWIDETYRGTRAMLELARRCGAQRFLFVSSGAVYGPQPPACTHVPESCGGAPDPQHTGSAYGQSKRMGEQLCAAYAHDYGIRTVSARLFALLSRHVPLDGAYAVGNFIRDALTKDHIAVQGDGTAMRSYIDGTDAAHWLFTLLAQGQGSVAYNVGSTDALSIGELATLVRDLLAPGKEVVFAAHPLPGGQRNRYVPDTARARQLGLEIRVPLAQAIRNAAAGIASAMSVAALR